MTDTEPEPTMNDRIRAGKPAKPDPFAKYRVEDTDQTPQTSTTDPKETDQ